MTNSVTANGKTYNDGDTPPNNMGNGGFRDNLIPMLGDVIADVAGKQAAALASQQAAAASASTAVNAPGTSATSATSLTVGIGTKALTITTGKLFSVGQQVRIARTSTPADWMDGSVQAHNSGTGAMTVKVTNIGVTTAGVYVTATDWTISVSGAPGTSGVVDELKGADIASAATINLTTATGNLVHVTGTTTITAITVPVGAQRTVIFDAPLTLTHSSALRLPSAANIVTEVNDRMIVRGDTTGAVVIGYTRASGLPIISQPYLHVRDEKASGTAGGVGATGNNVRTLNAVKTNTISGASVASDRISLPAGTYRISAAVPCGTTLHKASLYNHTDSADLVVGCSARASNSTSVATHSFINGRFTLGGTKEVKINHWLNGAVAVANDLGIPVTTGTVEVYTSVEIWKEA